MPVIVVHVKRDWLDDQALDAARVPGTKAALMAEMVRGIPERVAQAVNRYTPGGKKVKLDDTIMDVRPVHLWGHNMPDLWVEIRVDEIEGEDDERRRWLIQADIRRGIGFCMLSAPAGASRPTYDVQCDRLVSSGSSTDHNGDEIARWGFPASLKGKRVNRLLRRQ